LHIVVCVKQIFDPDVATTVFRIDEEANKIVPVSGISPVISPFDEQAVEAALRIKDDLSEQDLEVKVTVISMGPDTARAVIKGGLAKGADEGVLLMDSAFDDADAISTARVLAAAIKKMGDVDLVLAGRQAADGDLGAVGLFTAELLGVSAITYAKDVRMDGDTLRVVRVLENGTETVETTCPALVTISHELGQPRYTGLRETMRAAKKPVHVWTAEDLGIDTGTTGAAGARRVMERLYIPVKEIDCDYVEGETPQVIARHLAQRLRDAELV
jgi:electron transfer flavoprotein beta subunit